MSRSAAETPVAGREERDRVVGCIFSSRQGFSSVQLRLVFVLVCSLPPGAATRCHLIVYNSLPQAATVNDRVSWQTTILRNKHSVYSRSVSVAVARLMRYVLAWESPGADFSVVQCDC